MRSACLMGTEVALGVMKCCGTRKRRWLHNFVNVLNATERYTLKRRIVCCVDFASMKSASNCLVLVIPWAAEDSVGFTRLYSAGGWTGGMGSSLSTWSPISRNPYPGTSQEPPLCFCDTCWWPNGQNKWPGQAQRQSGRGPSCDDLLQAPF